jgi:hypothetical protein
MGDAAGYPSVGWVVWTFLSNLTYFMPFSFSAFSRASSIVPTM